VAMMIFRRSVDPRLFGRRRQSRHRRRLEMGRNLRCSVTVLSSW
jgi:hypothetical protein